LIAVFSALKMEIGDFKKGRRFHSIQPAGNWPAWKAKFGTREVLLVLTGVGRERARRCAGWVFAQFPVDLAVSTGFAGALSPQGQIGDVVVYSKLICGEDGQGGPPQKDVVCDPGWVRRAYEARTNSQVRRFIAGGVSINRVCSTPEAKLKLGRDCGCEAVDMESYWIGQQAAERQIPFITIRSISDTAREDLSWMEHIYSGNRFAPGKMLRWLLAPKRNQPASLKVLAEAYRHSRRAAANLGLVLDAMIACEKLENEKPGI
jgi:adenosylhomocysteine nucleosidase